MYNLRRTNPFELSPEEEAVYACRTENDPEDSFNMAFVSETIGK